MTVELRPAGLDRNFNRFISVERFGSNIHGHIFGIIKPSLGEVTYAFDRKCNESRDFLQLLGKIFLAAII